MSNGGKGSNPRPFSVPHEQFANSFDLIFRKTTPAKPVESNDLLETEVETEVKDSEQDG